MPRILTFAFKDIEIQVSFQSFSRDTLYGKSSRERRGEANEIYSNALLTRDGAHILPYGAIGANYTDPEGNFLAETLLIDSDGKAIPVARSMFKEPVKLTRTISLKDFYAYNVDRTYILKSENIDALDRLYLACRKLLELIIKMQNPSRISEIFTTMNVLDPNFAMELREIFFNMWYFEAMD